MGMTSTMNAVGSAAERLSLSARYDIESADALHRLAFVAQAIIRLGPLALESVPGTDVDEKIGFLIGVPAPIRRGEVDATICDFSDELIGGFGT